MIIYKNRAFKEVIKLTWGYWGGPCCGCACGGAGKTTWGHTVSLRSSLLQFDINSKCTLVFSRHASGVATWPSGLRSISRLQQACQILTAALGDSPSQFRGWGASYPWANWRFVAGVSFLCSAMFNCHFSYLLFYYTRWLIYMLMSLILFLWITFYSFIDQGVRGSWDSKCI